MCRFWVRGISSVFFSGEGGAEGAEAEEDNTVYEYKPPEAKVWEHLGSQAEIQDEAIIETREKVNLVTKTIHFQSNWSIDLCLAQKF